ncbi:hypothetical protein [Paenibacillus sp. FSL H7-0331]|uniref:hypothetical protein n=1 Tax=Paenibacillus sp. FSL H7-0331 TaxID=1920421 RepID=UPI0015C402D8|nr:hypothetical protein [Paenibacillus sp. FSL H7-0331]
MKDAGLDMFSALQEITKTPIEAVSVKQDGWGNVVSVERKKPFLRLVDKLRK